jgi:phosphate transport system permease protein
MLAIVAITLIFGFLLKSAAPMWTSEEVRKEVSQAQMWFATMWPGYDEAVNVWQPVSDVPKYGLWPLLTGTLKSTLVSMAIAGPLGVLAAIYVAFYARGRVREVLKPTLELLAGIPSVVLGFFALVALATWLQDTFNFDSRLNAVVSGVALAMAIVPVVFTLSEEAIGAVPATYVEASTALGAAKWQTVLKVVLPTAAPGIASAIALGFGRAVGETMIVLMASGNAAITSWNPADSVRTLSATVASELGEVVFGSAHYAVLFYLGLLLFVFTTGLNILGGRVIDAQKAKVKGR